MRTKEIFNWLKIASGILFIGHFTSLYVWIIFCKIREIEKKCPCVLKFLFEVKLNKRIGGIKKKDCSNLPFFKISDYFLPHQRATLGTLKGRSVILYTYKNPCSETFTKRLVSQKQHKNNVSSWVSLKIACFLWISEFKTLLSC